MELPTPERSRRCRVDRGARLGSGGARTRGDRRRVAGVGRPRDVRRHIRRAIRKLRHGQRDDARGGIGYWPPLGASSVGGQQDGICIQSVVRENRESSARCPVRPPGGSPPFGQGECASLRTRHRLGGRGSCWISPALTRTWDMWRKRSRLFNGCDELRPGGCGITPWLSSTCTGNEQPTSLADLRVRSAELGRAIEAHLRKLGKRCAAATGSPGENCSATKDTSSRFRSGEPSCGTVVGRRVPVRPSAAGKTSKLLRDDCVSRRTSRRRRKVRGSPRVPRP